MRLHSPAPRRSQRHGAELQRQGTAVVDLDRHLRSRAGHKLRRGRQGVEHQAGGDAQGLGQQAPPRGGHAPAPGPGEGRSQGGDGVGHA